MKLGESNGFEGFEQSSIIVFAVEEFNYANRGNPESRTRNWFGVSILVTWILFVIGKFFTEYF